MKFQYYRLEALTPVHIGTGDSLDPFSYVIRAGALHYIDLTGWVESHPDPVGLARKLSGEVHAVRAHIAETIDLQQFSLATAKVLSRKVEEEYRTKLKDPRNQLKIAPALKNAASHGLVVPGSSIKGAIRTAVIDLLDRKHRLGLKKATQDDKSTHSGNRNYDAKLKEALGDIGSNAFKNLKISDFEAPPDASALISAQEVGKKADKKPTPKDPCEVLPGSCMGQGILTIAGKIGIGTAGADKPKGECLEISFADQRLSLSADQLAELCSTFYRKRYMEEKKKFYGLPHLAKTAKALEAVEGAILNTPPGVFLLRIGHYSHVECMTVTDNLPETRKVKEKQMPFGTTRTLADGIYPFGWIRLVPCSYEEYQESLESRGQVPTREHAYSADFSSATAELQRPTIVAEQVIWEGASLTWNPGNATLTAIAADGKKAETKIGTDRSLVSEEVITRLKKGKPVRSKVTLEKQGNSLTIVEVEQ